MKFGIDNLIKILEDYQKGVAASRQNQADAIKQYKPDVAQTQIKEYQESLKRFSEKQAGYFSQQIAETIAAVEKDQSVSKYVSDPGFANAVQIVSSGGKTLDSDVMKSLVRPYLDDYIARQSLAAIIRQQGRDPKLIGIVEGTDALSILKEVQRNSWQTFTGWTGTDFPMTSEPSVLIHNLKRANNILEGDFEGESYQSRTVSDDSKSEKPSPVMF